MIPAKKSLGQHFLTNKSYLRAIVNALENEAAAKMKTARQRSLRGAEQRGATKQSRIFERDCFVVPPRNDSARTNVVIEIGPGKGSLTSELLTQGFNIIALEKDRRLIPFLNEKFSAEISSGQLKIIQVDALDFEFTSNQKLVTSYQLVGNIPYYITGALLSKFLTIAAQPKTIVFLVQKEVAERIARSKKESLLSLSVKAYGTPKYIKTVPAGAFSPAPKVDSAILQISSISRSNFKNAEHEKRFFEIIHAGFAHKRKLLMRNLENVFERKETIAQLFKTLGISANARAEDVPLEKWLALAKFIH